MLNIYTFFFIKNGDGQCKYNSHLGNKTFFFLSKSETKTLGTFTAAIVFSFERFSL